MFGKSVSPTRTQPGAATTGAKIDDPPGTAVPNRAENLRLDGAIDVCPADDGFETIRGAVPYRLRAPRLIENLQQLKTLQTFIANLSTKPSPRAAPPRWR
jgi:hypothetical protein